MGNEQLTELHREVTWLWLGKSLSLTVSRIPEDGGEHMI